MQADAGGVPELGDLLGNSIIPADPTTAAPAAVSEVPQEAETPVEKSKRNRRKSAAVETPAEQVKAENIEASQTKVETVTATAPVAKPYVGSHLPLTFCCQLGNATQYGKLLKYAGQLILGEA